MRQKTKQKSALNRRAFLTGAASLVGITAAQALFQPVRAQTQAVPEDPTRVPGSPPSPYGQRATFEQAVRLAGTLSSFTPLQTLHGIVTPSALHFERHHNGVPLIDSARNRGPEAPTHRGTGHAVNGPTDQDRGQLLAVRDHPL